MLIYQLRNTFTNGRDRACTGWPAGSGPLGLLQNSEWAHFFGSYGPFRRFGGPISKRGLPEMNPFSWFGPALPGSKKHESLKQRQKYKTPNGPTEHACCLKHGCVRMCFSLEEKCTLKKCMYLSKMGLFILPPALLTISGGPITGKQVFCVCSLLCVCSPCRACQIRVGDVFCVVSLCGTIRSATSVLLEKTPLAATRAFSLRTQAFTKVPSVLWDLQDLDTERAVS